MAFSVNAKELKLKEQNDKLLAQALEKEAQEKMMADQDTLQQQRVQKRGIKTLKQSGVLDSYQYLLTSLCKYGLPTGDLYEFAALQVLRFEKKQKTIKKKELEERLRVREAQRKEASMMAHAQALAMQKSPNQGKSRASKAQKQAAAQPKTTAGASLEPNYDDIRLTEEQQAVIFEHIEKFWPQFLPEGADALPQDLAKEMLKAVSEDNFINQAIYDQTFVGDGEGGTSGPPLAVVTLEQMHQCSQVYILFMERQRAQEIYEAELQLAQLNQVGVMDPGSAEAQGAIDDAAVPPNALNSDILRDANDVQGIVGAQDQLPLEEEEQVQQAQ